MEQNQKKNYPVIRCPHCGGEYTPADIFMPGDLIGKPKTVIRDALGKIIYQEYDQKKSQLNQKSISVIIVINHL